MVVFAVVNFVQKMRIFDAQNLVLEKSLIRFIAIIVLVAGRRLLSGSLLAERVTGLLVGGSKQLLLCVEGERSVVVTSPLADESVNFHICWV